MMKIHKTQATKLADFIASIRADWDPHGTREFILRSADRGDPADIAIAAIRAAADPANRTPSVIAMDGPHWQRPDGKPSGKFLPHCRKCRSPHWKHHDCEPIEAVPLDGQTPGATEFRTARQALRTEEDQ